jgi:hypothetical protein
MSRKRIENRIEDLEPEQSDNDAAPLMISMTHITEPGGVEPTYDNSPHPELTVPQHQGTSAETLVIATPNVIPEPYCNESILSVCSCKTEKNYNADWMNDEQRPILACELWDALSDEQLTEERQIREANDEPIPEVLAEHE